MAKKAKKKAYAYWLGQEQGVVETWAECEALVKGKTARYRGFPTRAEAEAWLAAGAPYEAKPKAAKKRAARADLPDDGIYFDAGTGRGVGTEARVTDKDGTPLTFMALDENEVTAEGNLRLAGRTNNYGELMACYLALQIACKMGKKHVLGDSKLVIAYWSKGRIRKEAAADETLLALVRKVQTLRARFEAQGGRMTHISGDINPADLGFHR